jgi:hypothetical protein
VSTEKDTSKETPMINWTVESIAAENRYRRERLHRLAGDRHTNAHRVAQHDAASWWRRLRSGD